MLTPIWLGCASMSMALVFLTSSCNKHNSSFVWNNFDDCHHWNEKKTYVAFQWNCIIFEKMPPLTRLMKDVWLGGTFVYMLKSECWN